VAAPGSDQSHRRATNRRFDSCSSLPSCLALADGTRRSCRLLRLHGIGGPEQWQRSAGPYRYAPLMSTVSTASSAFSQRTRRSCSDHGRLLGSNQELDCRRRADVEMRSRHLDRKLRLRRAEQQNQLHPHGASCHQLPMTGDDYSSAAFTVGRTVAMLRANRITADVGDLLLSSRPPPPPTWLEEDVSLWTQ
jgi:hypothetical protein